MLLLIGIAGHYLDAGSLEFGGLSVGRASDVLILVAFLVNAAAWPLSAWLPDAYPEASWSGTVFLSAFTTKVAAYALMRGFPGTEVLIVVGLVMVVYGLVYALREDDLRRVLAYGIVNQVGFLVAAVGIGSELAINGAAAHAVNHILYKALLLMAAGSVLFATGRRRLSELGGLHRSMPQTAILAVVGLLAMAAFPLTSGFVTKSMIPSAAAEAHLFVPWLVLHAASGGALLIALRFVWFTFFGKDSGLRPSDPPIDMRLAMAVLAIDCIVIGVAPALLYELLPFRVTYEPYTGWHVVGQLQLLLFAGLAFFVLLDWLGKQRGTTLDTDWAWRVAMPSVAGAIAEAWRALGGAAAAGWESTMTAVTALLRRTHGPEGILARSWPIRATGMWMLVMMLVMLVVGFIHWTPRA
jgi:multicomponent Na+:H+ antiporter subunit D